MNLVIAAVSSNRAMSGVSRHAANLTKCLLNRPELSALHLLVAPWEYKHMCEAIARKDKRLHIHPIGVRPGTLYRNLWYYRSLPAIAEQLRADIVHIAYPSPIRSGSIPCPAVLTLHDLYPFDIPANFGFPKVMLNRMVLRHCLTNATAIACVSESTKLRLGLKMPEVLPKAVTICNSVESGPIPSVPSFAATWGNAPFLLCVAQHRRNKNVLLAIRAFKRVIAAGQITSDSRLVIVGVPGPESAKIYCFVRATGLSERIVFVSGISDAEMTWCYRNCELLLAPSSVEGFGLPVVEAELAGCRIVCSDIPAFREVGNEGCRYVELTQDSDQQFAKAIVLSLRERRPLPSHLPHLSPANIADQYVRLYNAVLSPASAGVAPVAPKGKAVAMPAQTSITDEVPNAAQF
ncbi:MAG: glycosyltransferase family 1 protein [Terracidiphilus sp.]